METLLICHYDDAGTQGTIPLPQTEGLFAADPYIGFHRISTDHQSLAFYSQSNLRGLHSTSLVLFGPTSDRA